LSLLLQRLGIASRNSELLLLVRRLLVLL